MSDAFSHLPYRPCAGVMLINAKGHVFVGQRLDSEVAAWQMPQGGIDPGETAREAALRELWEETGVTSDKVDILAVTETPVRYELPEHLIGKLWKGRFRGQEQTWTLMAFRGVDADVNIATEHPEFSEWRWLPHTELSANIVPFKRAVYDAVTAEFAPHIAAHIAGAGA